MKRLAPVIVLLLACLAVAGLADAKRDPRLEKLALRAGDTESAQKALVRRSELPAGWRLEGGSSSEDAPPCRWNLSRFTITGQANATFSQGLAAVFAEVNVFPTSAQALGDYAVQVNPKALACEGEYLRSSFGPTTTLVSARAISAPRIGDRSAARRWVFKLNGTTITVELHAFARGRTNGAVFTLIPGAPMPGLDALAGAMAGRVTTT